jgi:hypothetical protein
MRTYVATEVPATPHSPSSAPAIAPTPIAPIPISPNRSPLLNMAGAGVGPSQTPDSQLALWREEKSADDEEEEGAAGHEPGDFGGAGTPRTQVRNMESFLNYRDSPLATPEPQIPLIDLTRSSTPPAAAAEEMEGVENEVHGEMGEKEKKEVADWIMGSVEDICGR